MNLIITSFGIPKAFQIVKAASEIVIPLNIVTIRSNGSNTMTAVFFQA